MRIKPTVNSNMGSVSRSMQESLQAASPAAEKPLCCCLHSPEAVRRGARGARRVRALLIVLIGVESSL